jgi:hypothetical protein
MRAMKRLLQSNAIAFPLALFVGAAAPAKRFRQVWNTVFGSNPLNPEW